MESIGWWCTIVFLFWLFLTDVSRTLRTVAVYQKLPISETFNILSVAAKRDSLLLTFIPLPLAALLYWHGEHERIYYPYYIYLPFIVIQVGLFVRSFLPPTILLLGNSNWESARLFNTLERGLWPYRVVALLEPSLIEPTRHSITTYFGFAEGNLRMKSPHQWRRAVRQMTSYVPFIVLDTRIASPGVIEEVKILLSNNLNKKTVFVINEDDAAPALEMVADLPEEINTVRYDRVLQYIKKSGNLRTQSPDEAPLIGTVNYNLFSRKFSRAMMKIARLAPALEAALQRTEYSYGRTPLTERTRLLFLQIGGTEGDGAIEAIDQLGSDIKATKELLEAWAASGGPDHDLRIQLSLLYDGLCKLQKLMDIVPQAFLEEMRTRLPRNQRRGLLVDDDLK